MNIYSWQLQYLNPPQLNIVVQYRLCLWVNLPLRQVVPYFFIYIAFMSFSTPSFKQTIIILWGFFGGSTFPEFLDIGYLMLKTTQNLQII